MINLEKIIEGCRKQDSNSQRLLFNHFSPILLGVCRRYVTNLTEAEDILQEGFVKIFFNIINYTGKGALENWMKKIMINTAITYYHKNIKHNKDVSIDNVSEANFSSGDITSELFSANELLEIIDTLPQGYKMVFNLYAIEGYKHREIAGILNIDENTSKSQYARARKWIQNKLDLLNKMKLVKV